MGTAHERIKGKTLRKLGWDQGKVVGLALAAAEQLQADGSSAAEALARLEQVRATPEAFLADPVLGDLARECQEHALASLPAGQRPGDLRPAPLPYPTWGEGGIDPAAKAQMNTALRLPVAVAGALMPDAHLGYGLPIGGVLATTGAVIPYAVGVDIACRMRLSVYDCAPVQLDQQPQRFATALRENTRFGAGSEWGRPQQHEVLDDAAWRATPLLDSLHDKACRQLGTSGSGNHFVEWGELEVTADAADLGLKAGRYLALLSHSGSRGVGARIADHYSRLARQLHPRLEKAALHLGWLDLAGEAGQEYWLSMELAGRFASACHHLIHHRVARGAGLDEVASVENHHNYAWRERLADGTEVIVHRKGATPAGPGVLGVIPGSMADSGFVVRGRGQAAALHSASHGAGRAMSRTAAFNSISKQARNDYLRERRVTLLGGGLDEAPQAYKRIEDVMAAQAELVEVVARFTPRIVMMSEEAEDI